MKSVRVKINKKTKQGVVNATILVAVLDDGQVSFMTEDGESSHELADQIGTANGQAIAIYPVTFTVEIPKAVQEGKVGLVGKAARVTARKAKD